MTTPTAEGGRPMSVLHLSTVRTLSGGVRQAVLLFRGLSAAGHRVTVCCPEGSHLHRLAAEAGADCRPFPVSTGSLWGQWKASRWLRQVAEEVRADVVHTHQNKGHNIGLLATFGGPFPPVLVKRAVLYRPKFPYKFRTPRVKAIVCNTQAVKRVLVGCGVLADKVHVIYNGQPPRDLAPIAAARERVAAELGTSGAWPVIGTVGSGRPEKGFQHLVEAAPLLLETFPDAVFVLLGPHVEALVPRIRELGLEQRFRLPGFRTDVLEIANLFDVFVFPGVHKDSCSNVILEAMSIGKPVVASDMVGMDEILRDGGLGLPFRAGDPGELARATAALLGDPERARAMGQRALREISERYRPEDKLAEMVRLYRELSASAR